MCGMKWRKRQRGALKTTPGDATGNRAFDGYIAEALARIEAQRQALAAEEKAFMAFLEEQKLIRDRGEFELFLKARQQGLPPPATAA